MEKLLTLKRTGVVSVGALITVRMIAVACMAIEEVSLNSLHPDYKQSIVYLTCAYDCLLTKFHTREGFCRYLTSPV